MFLLYEMGDPVTEIKKAINQIGAEYTKALQMEREAEDDDRRIFCSGMATAWKEALKILDEIEKGEK